MQCDVCSRSANDRLTFNCTLCARDALYNQRLQLAQTLLQRERLGKEVEGTTAASPTLHKLAPSKNSKPSEPQPNPSWLIQCAAAEQVLSEEKTESILYHIKKLREEIQKTKDDISERKARSQRRQLEFTSAKQELLQSQATGTEPVEKSIQRTRQRWNVMHVKSAESRFFLCKEAATLYGLRQRKCTKDGLGRDVYYIGGVPLANLRDLNNASPAQVTTSLTNLAHLTHLASHYLALRLPAEIILPHCDHPFPTISSPSSSYSGRDVPVATSSPPQTSDDSPSTSHSADQRSLPKPRPLRIDKKLSSLAKDDPIAYALFVEGVTFLAWNIAWLCKTQGATIGDNSWEDVCAMGGNLYQLLLSPPARPPLSREVSSKSSPQKPPKSHLSKAGAHAAGMETIQGVPHHGYFSHGTAFGCLAAAAGSEHMRSWRLQSPVKVIEKVKTMLLAERTGAEWEILEGNEWEVEDNETEGNGDSNRVSRFAIEDTGVLVKPEMDGRLRNETEEGRKDHGEARGKSTSGWTKLKNRQS